MRTIIFITIITLVLFLFLTSRFLLKDLFRLFWKYTKSLFISHGVTFYCELGITILIVVLLTMGAAAVHSAAAALFSFITTNDLAEFCITYRGVFSFYTSDIQSPSHHFLWLFISPLYKLLSAFVLVWSIRRYFTSFNKRYNRGIYSESDCFYFSLIGVSLLFGFEVFMHTQSINRLNLISNSLYIILQNLSLFLFFFSYYWIMSSETHHLTEDMEKYLVMGKIEKTIISSPWLQIVFTYILSIVLTVPSYLGLQFQPNNKLLFSVFIVIVIISFFLTKRTMARSWNYLSAILFDSTFEQTLIEPTMMKLNRCWTIVLCSLFGIIILLFSLFYSQSMFMFTFLSLCLIMMLIVISSVVYGVLFLVDETVAMIKKEGHLNNRWGDLINYVKRTTLSFVSAFLSGYCFVFVIFLLVTVFPKSLDCSCIYSNNNYIVDPDGEVLWLDTEQERYYAPISSGEIPQWYVDMLLLQEDRCFREQKFYFPNKSNWHGLSPAIIKRGGSNLNCQIIKQMSYSSAPRDGSRKTSDLLGAYQSSLQYSLEELIDLYLNISSFNGARGYQGINAASIFTFGRAINKINSLEMLYLISTLPRATYLTDGERRIAYTCVQENPELVKSILLKKAKKWKSEGLISNREYRQLCNDSLCFSTLRYKCNDLPASTRLYLERTFKDSPGRHDCFITLENERALTSAYNLLKTKNVFQSNNSELQVAAMVVEANSGKIVGHFSSSEVVDYANCYSYPVGSVLKPVIVLEIIKSGAPIDFKLFDGRVGQRKTPRNSHGGGYSNVPVDAVTILSRSLNGPFSNLIDLGLNPKSVYQNLENEYASMGIAKDTVSAADTYNYPLGIREMRVFEVAQIYQTIFNNGVFIPLSLEQTADTIVSNRIWDEAHVNVVKNALHQTIDDSNGTLYRYKNDLPQGKNFYGKTGTSTRQRDFWTVLSDGNLVVVCWASYGKQVGDRMVLGTEKSWGASAAGQFSVLIYNELTKTNHF